MNTQSHSRTILAVVIFLIFLLVGYFYVFDPGQDERYLPVGVSDFRNRTFYRIDTASILNSLAEGETNLFAVQETAPETSNARLALWRQSDFIGLARVLNQVVWQEPLSSWRLYSMHFSTPCKDNLSGFAEADFYYFKTTFRENGKIRYTTQNIFISPEYEQVIWSGGANFPHPLIGWDYVRLRQIQISAEDALAIAEANGGRETRQLVDNSCRIHVRLASDQTWQILIYQNDTGSSLFRMVIDSDSGNIE